MKVNRQAGIHLHEKQFYWILIARNGKTIAEGKPYKRKGSAVASIVVATGIVLGRTPYALIPYYDHSKPGAPVKYC